MSDGGGAIGRDDASRRPASPGRGTDRPPPVDVLPAHAAAHAERRAERIVLVLFAASLVTGIALLIVYILGGQTQIEGVLLTICLGGIGAGIVVWAQRLMPTRVHVEPRGHVGGDASEMEGLGEALTEESGFSRRKLLIRALGGAFVGLAAALAIPVFSLGPVPGRSLVETSWRAGRRLALPGQPPVDPAQVPIGGVLTVFPDGDESDPNAATLLIRVEPRALQLDPRHAQWAPEGFVAYSKVCTHAGCPVGLYRAEQHTLICPCHQSEFDVLTGANPISGPAARALPQLPMALQGSAFVALGDFDAPVGPSFWDMPR